jgi:GntR family transcriptional regulator, transcriptional repressor for pyruvate dehydrogenase complex
MSEKGIQASMALLRSVAGRDDKRVREIIEVRRMLEPEIAALAARNAGPADVARIMAIVDGQERALALGREDPGADEHFHMSLARITGNEVLCEVAAVLQDILAGSREPRLLGPERLKASLEGHKAIAAALSGGDEAACRELMREHLDRVENKLFGEQ